MYETLILIAFVLLKNDIKHQKIFFESFSYTKKFKKMGKRLLKMCKKLSNLRNTKIQKQTNLSIFCKSNDELNNIS